MGILKFACAAGVAAAAAGTAYLYRRIRKTREQEEVNTATSLHEETLMVAYDYMVFCVGIKRTPPSKSAKAMRYLAKEVENAHFLPLRRQMQIFLIANRVHTWTHVRNLMLDLVHHENMSWRQIVILFTIMGILAVEMFTIDEDVHCIRRLALMMTDVLIGERQEWMIQNGGWRGFVDYVHTFRLGHPESPVKTTLFAAAHVAIAFLLISYLLKRTLPRLHL